MKRKPLALIKKLRKAKKDATSGEKPEPVRTHLRNMIIVPEMIGSVIGVYNGKTFNQVSSRLWLRFSFISSLLSTAGLQFANCCCVVLGGTAHICRHCFLGCRQQLLH